MHIQLLCGALACALTHTDTGTHKHAHIHNTYQCWSLHCTQSTHVSCWCSTVPACSLSLSLSLTSTHSLSESYSYEDLCRDFSKYDLKRLDLYSRNMADHHLITDLLPLRMLLVVRTYFFLLTPMLRPTGYSFLFLKACYSWQHGWDQLGVVIPFGYYYVSAGTVIIINVVVIVVVIVVVVIINGWFSSTGGYPYCVYILIQDIKSYNSNIVMLSKVK